MNVSDEIWRVLVNSYDDLPANGTGPPAIETLHHVVSEDAVRNFAEDSDDVFVQKVVTEMYIFTDSQNQVFGEHTFQDMVILGNMSKDKLTKLLNRQRRKRDKGS